MDPAKRAAAFGQHTLGEANAREHGGMEGGAVRLATSSGEKAVGRGNPELEAARAAFMIQSGGRDWASARQNRGRCSSKDVPSHLVEGAALLELQVHVEVQPLHKLCAPSPRS